MKKNKDTEKETEKETPAWMLDGRRYAAAIQQDIKDKSCVYYKDFFDSDEEKEAKAMALNSAQREKCKAWVFDRKESCVIHRYDFTEPKIQIPKEDDLLKKKKRKR
jgi:hypothetical protein